jgi:predicted nucleotidyltransferase
MALCCGADLVLELPLPWAISSAKRFAEGAVAALDAAGIVTVLSFGSEAGELSGLEAVADCLFTPEYEQALRLELKKGVSFAAARQRAVKRCVGEAAQLLSLPNNILAIEYLYALKQSASSIRPVTVRREGAGHDEISLPDQCPSASALRSLLARGETPPSGWMPEQALELWEKAAAAGSAPAGLKHCERALLARLRTMREEEYEALPDGGEGLWNRLMRAARTGGSIEEILSAAKTKRYAEARLRRMLIWAYLGMGKNDLPSEPAFLRVLGFNARGAELLKDMRKKAALPVITKPAHAKKLDDAGRRMFELDARATDLYLLCRPELTTARGGLEWTTDPVRIGK